MSEDFGEHKEGRGVAAGASEPSAGPMRIGVLSRRVGVRPETLRAWERRYNLFDPGRTPGNYRLYSAEDEVKARSMAALIAGGISAAEAAKLTRASPQVAGRSGSSAVEAGRARRSSVPAATVTPAADAGAEVGASAEHPALSAFARELLDALARFDGERAQAILDSAFARFSLEAVVCGLVLQVLGEIGERWERGRFTIAQEHFSAELLRGRLDAVARGWGSGDGPLALLACPPGERHDLGLISFGLLLRERGWRITILGPDMPIDILAEAADGLRPDAVVLAAVSAERFEAERRGLRALAERTPVMLGGAGVDRELAGSLGARCLERDPAAAAQALTDSLAPAS